jgi:rSAM/selenodomain-associated transferase 2/rSAM/selenodomain-associated transferase 1
MNTRLIIFTRYPVPGRTKTRLIPALGAEGAAELQRQMTEHTLVAMRPLLEEGIGMQVRFDGGELGEMTQWLGEDLNYAPQGEGDLGKRMSLAFTASFKEGFEKAVIVGTDCPSLDSVNVAEAFDLLEENSLVLGPAADGGYYLIGTRSDAPHWLNELVFENIPWGTDQVFNSTMNALAETGLDVGLLDEKADVDEPEDLEQWYKEVGSQNPESRIQNKANISISVIIPALNEEERIGEVLERLKVTGVEIVVADGGSADGTVAACEAAGVKVVHAGKGRAVQMNAGAAEASGNVFLFLHADTRLPEGFLEEVKGTVAQGAVAGAFLFGTDMNTSSMGIIENAAHFRAFRLGIVFGDQAIFATREAFFRAGGYPVQPIMEDYELWKRLGKVGKRSLIPQSVTTSARKWEKYGTWRVSLINLAVTWLYVLGVSPERLAKWYRGRLQKMENGK